VLETGEKQPRPQPLEISFALRNLLIHGICGRQIIRSITGGRAINAPTPQTVGTRHAGLGKSGRILNYAEAARALNVSQPTARDYFEIAHGTFVWRRIPAFSRDAMKRVVKHPRGYLRDTGLLHALLRIPDLDALLSHPQMGASWEGMVVEEIFRQLNAQGVACDYSYYRTGGGAEVDLVLEGDFGRVAVEIKHTSTVTARDLRGLGDFIREHHARLGVVITNSYTIQRFNSNLLGLPFHWL
jgi:uncharacterized protein